MSKKDSSGAGVVFLIVVALIWNSISKEAKEQDMYEKEAEAEVYCEARAKEEARELLITKYENMKSDYLTPEEKKVFQAVGEAVEQEQYLVSDYEEIYEQCMYDNSP